MPYKVRPLTQQQHEVLQWIQDGCPSGVYTSGYEHRIVAKGLERRGFVTVSGRGPTWIARIRPAGEERLQTEPPIESKYDSGHPEADQLLQQVIDAGGELRISSQDSRDFSELIEHSLKSPVRPYGKMLTRLSEFRRTLAVLLVDNLEEVIELRPVPMVQKIHRYHPSVKRFKESRDIQWVTQEHIQRAVLLLQSIAEEVERRGIEIVSPDTVVGTGRRSSSDRYKFHSSHLLLKIADSHYTVQIREITAQAGAKLDYGWKERSKMPGWMLNRGYEFTSSGRLDVIIDGRWTSYNGKHFRDGKRQRLEERLPEILRQLEIYRERSKQWDYLQEKTHALNQERREKEATQARKKYFKTKRWEYFQNLSKQWESIEKHREFLSRARAAAQTLTGDSRTETLSALDEAEENIRNLDPLENPKLLQPNIQEPSDEDLRPYLPNRSMFDW